MNNFDKINFDITKYSNLELKEILDLSNVTECDQIQKHISNIQMKISTDGSMSFTDKNKMLIFLNQAKTKFNENNYISNNLDLTFNANTSYLVPNTPDSNPLILDPNTLIGSNVKVSEGKGGYYPSGYLNPINIKTNTKTINIDSRFRDQYYNTKSSDFYFNLSETFRKVVNLSLISYEIPLTIYSINSYNNYFTISPSSNTYQNIDISNGNYGTIFSNKLFDLSNSDIVLEMNNNISSFNISYGIDSISGKSYFINNNATQVEIIFNRDINGEEDLSTPIQLKLGWSLGFQFGNYILPPNSTVWSDGIVNLSTNKYLYISIDDFTHAGNNSFVATFSESTLSDNIITKINYSDLLNYYGRYNTGSQNKVCNANRSYYGPVDINKLHIKVMDEYGKIIDFNNMDWSFTINIDVLYD